MNDLATAATRGIGVDGNCDPRFRRVREVFEEGFRSRDEIGAAVAVTVDGRPVVDLWGGHADVARTRPWQRDTIVNVYSTTKGIVAICAMRLADEGELDVDAPVTRYWPEFGQAGKEEVPVRWLLSHRAGLPAVKSPLPGEALYDWGAMTAALAAQEPWWTPGTRHGYHAVTYGWLVGEVIRRIAGKSLGAYLRDEIARPLGLDLHVGLLDDEHGRCAEMTPIPTEPAPEGRSLADVILADPQGMSALSFMNPPSMALGVNNAEWRRAEIPGANGHGSARSIARLYGALACGGSLDGVRIMRPEAVVRCHAEQAWGTDAVLQIPTRIGMGFMLSQQGVTGGAFGPGPRAFGHPGAGGSVGFADPDARIGFSYVMNRMGPYVLMDPRATALIDAVYDSVS
ncbi:MAG TPA: serine hydrolase domain-containing protein [Candidatus Binatia bacterium]|nr:serine hydrolase domain-containing protein [Candidatus Binatia bacterium]